MLALVHVHPAQLGAAVQLGEDLARVEDLGRVEGAFDPLLLGEVVLVEHGLHQVALLDADAMLAGEHAADLDAEPEDVGAERLGRLDLARDVRVVEDQRVQVAVAGVEDVGDAQAVLARHLLHAVEDEGQLLARDRAVHAQIVGRQAAGGGEGVLAAGPEGQALGLALGHLAVGAAMLAGDAADDADQVVDLGRGPVELADQQGLGVARVAGGAEVLGRVDRRVVHHLEPARDDAGGDDRGDAVAALVDGRESRSARRGRSRAWAGCGR